MEYIHHYDSPLGGIILASNGQALTGLWFEDQKYVAATLSPDHTKCALPVFDLTAKWLDLYFSGKIPDFTPPLCIKTTDFRKAIAQIMLTIPYGQTMTYGQITSIYARQKGLPHMSAQAVGGAVGHNPISLIIPCHRVIGIDGSLTGYAGGLDRKIKLLKLEKVSLPFSRTN